MKRILLKIIFTFLSLYTVQNFSQIREYDKIKNIEGEYIVTRSNASNIGYRSSDVRDFIFTFDFSFNTAIYNHFLLEQARRRALNHWFNRQNQLIKKHLEKKFGEKFGNFGAARNRLFSEVEHSNILRNSDNVKSKHNGVVYRERLKGYKSLKSLKALKIRQQEIASGDLHKSVVADFKINGKPLLSFRDLGSIKRAWNSQFKSFSSSKAKEYISLDVLKKLEDSDGIANATLREKIRYYNSFNRWDRLNLMQLLINYEELYERQKNSPVLPNVFGKFWDLDRATPKFIENYAKRNRKGGISIFDSRYLSIQLRAASGYQGHIARIIREKIKSRYRMRKIEAFDNLLKKTYIHGSLSGDNVVNIISAFEKVIDPYQKLWIIKNPDKAKFLSAQFHNSQYLIIHVIYPMVVKPRLIKGAARMKKVQKVVRSLGFDDDSLEANWMYNDKNDKQFKEVSNFLKENGNSVYAKAIIKQGIIDEVNSSKGAIKDIINVNRFRKYLEGQSNIVSWTPSKGTYLNRTALKYTHKHVYPNGDIQYLLESKGQLFVSQTRRKLNYRESSIIGSTEDNGPYHYISFPGSKNWHEFSLFSFQANCTSCELNYLMKTVLTKGLKLVGEYVIPVEDTIILIDGKDFEGNVSSRVAAGLLILVDVGGGKFFKAVKALPAGVKAWAVVQRTAKKSSAKLIFKTVGNIIKYGRRSQLATVLGTAGTGFRAHHVIPWRFNNNPIVQAASKYKKHWHPNSILNGKGVEYARHKGSHGTYDTWVRIKLDALMKAGVHNNPKRAYEELLELAQTLKKIIDENPNVKINDLPLP